jgi:hypothetical protein
VRTVGYAFAAWTLFVWTTRIRNILSDGDASGTSRAVDLAVAAGLCALAVVVAFAWWRRRPRWAVPALGVATVTTWAVRVPLITANPEWDAGFKVVHAGLAVVSIALAWAAWRRWSARTGPAGPASARAEATAGA